MAAEPARTVVADGRNARALRTREAVADALLALLEAGTLQPTAQQVATRAGVSERAVFRHFEDLEALFGTVAARQIDRVSSKVPAVLIAGSLAERIAALVARHAALYEQISPVRRAALRQEPFSRVVAEKLQWSRDALRTEVVRIFAPEVARLAMGERQAVRDALGMVTSWSAWENLRRHAGLSVARTERAVARTLTALLQPRHKKESA